MISGEMDVKHSSGSVLTGSWVFLGHVHLPVFLPEFSFCLIAHGHFNLGCCSVLLLVLRGSIKESSRSAFLPWILSGDIHPVLCVVSITGVTAGRAHPWLSQ